MLVTVGAVNGLARRACDPRIVVLLGSVVVASLLGLHIVAYELLLVDASDPIIVGRQFLVLIGPFALLVAIAVTGLQRRVAEPVTALLLGGLVALNLGALGVTMVRFYG